MAVIKNFRNHNHSAFNALTAAAVALPGMLPGSVNALEEAEYTVQYGHYEEGYRHVNTVYTGGGGDLPIKVNVPKHLKPIQAESLLQSIKMAFNERIRFVANFSQDTWAGATPIASAPAVFGANDVSNVPGGPEGPLYVNGVVTGASPLISTPSGNLLFDPSLNPLLGGLVFNSFPPHVVASKDTEIAHTMAEATPEIRRQGDFSLSYEWDNAALTLGGGISVERDYESRFYNIGGRLDFNRKLTTLDFGLSYTNSRTDALVDHHANAYLYLADNIQLYGFSYIKDDKAKSHRIQARRQDWGFDLGLTQVVSPTSLLKLGVNYKYSQGYMSNPYKGVTYFYNLQPYFPSFGGVGVLQAAAIRTKFERRPLERNQLTWSARWVQRVKPANASLHVGYRFSHDDWGIHTHTFDAQWIQSLGWGWSVTPKIRYYSQSAAYFYTPYMVFREADPVLPDYFSSDHRLSGFGALSGGISVQKQFTKGVSLEAGFEYYTHQGQLKLGGGGEGRYADFDFYTVNAALNMDLSALGQGLSSTHSAQHRMQGAPLPAGVLFGHMLEQHQWMFAYRYRYQSVAGDLLHGQQAVSDVQAVNNGCEGNPCFVAPTDMTLHMHMFNIMYAPTDWMTLMLMPQFVDMSMNMRELAGRPRSGSETNSYRGIAVSHTRHEHETGGLGDTGIFALFRLFQDSMHHLHLTLGVNAPTGDYDFGLRGAHGYTLGLIHYGMQIGSGTWDLRPNLTYTGQWNDVSWGAQVNLTKRLGKSETGFAFGDILQATAWTGYKLTDWLNASVRGIYTTQGSLRGAYRNKRADVKVGTMDYGSNYGGRYWDLGVGLTATFNQGNFAGNSVSVEWLQPVINDVNGYQRERDGSLVVNWHYMF